MAKSVKQILKAHRSLQQLSSTPPDEWPAVNVSQQLTVQDGNVSYQGVQLRHYSDSVVTICKDQVLVDLRRLDGEIRERLEWPNTDMLRSILVYLNTQTWQGSDDDAIIREVNIALAHIILQFRAPLEAKSVDLSGISDEVDDMLRYARSYLGVGKDDHHRVWYQLATVAEASNWQNAVRIAELLFSLPFSTTKVEQMFSQLKLIKSERRTTLKQITLADLLEVTTEGPPCQHFVQIQL